MLHFLKPLLEDSFNVAFSEVVVTFLFLKTLLEGSCNIALSEAFCYVALSEATARRELQC